MKTYTSRGVLSVLTCSLFLSIGAGCSSNSTNTNGSDSNAVATAVVEHSDSLTATVDTAGKAAKPVGPVWGTKTFASAQEAIDYMNSSVDASKYASGIFHRMAEENLPYLTKLLNSPYQRFIVVDKEVMRVILFDKYGREILGYGMACARNYGTKHKKADSRTPEGFFSAEGVYDSTDWLFTNDNGYTSPAKGQFGPRFIRVKNPVSTQIGIHGTAAPGSIGHRVSHGCIRVKNENILELVKYVEVGMPIIISPSRRDTNVNKSEGYTISYITTDLTGAHRDELQAQYDAEEKARKEAAEKAREKKAKAKEETPDTTSTHAPAPATPEATPAESPASEE